MNKESIVLANVKKGGETSFSPPFPLPFRFFSLSLPTVKEQW